MKFCSRKFYALLFSSCIDMVIAFIMTLSDTLVAGHFLGEEAVAAIGIVNPIFSFGVAVSVLFSSGASVCYNRAMGSFDKEKAHKFFGLGVAVAVLAGIIMFIGTVFVKEIYIKSMNPTGEVLTFVNDYFTYYPHILLFYPIYTILSEMVYGDGDEASFTISSLFNVIGNPLVSIMLCPILGIRGISLGSLAGLLIAIVSLLPHFFKKSNSVRFKWHLSLKDIVKMMKYGINDASQFICFSVLQYVITAFAAARFGITAVTILPVIVSVVELSVIFDGIGQAVIPICSVYLGEGNSAGVRSIMKTAKDTAIIMGVLFSVLTIIFAP